MKEFTLKKKETDFFKLNIGEESYLIPLARSLTFEEVNRMKKRENVQEVSRSGCIQRFDC